MKLPRSCIGEKVGENWEGSPKMQVIAKKKVAKHLHMWRLLHAIFSCTKTHLLGLKKSHRELSAIYMFLFHTKLYRICIEHNLQLLFTVVAHMAIFTLASDIL